MDASPITINLSLGKWNGSDFDWSPVAISGPRDALCRDLVDDAVGGREGGYPFIDYVDAEYEQMYCLLVDRTATLAEVADALGDEIHAEPATLRLGASGRGGGGEFTLGALLQAADEVKHVGEWVGLGLVMWRAIVARYYRTTRRLAKDWIDTGEISMDLRQAVLAYNPWEREDFDKVFKLRDRGPELLRALGYERDMEYGERWWEVANREWRRNE